VNLLSASRFSDADSVHYLLATAMREINLCDPARPFFRAGQCPRGHERSSFPYRRAVAPLTARSGAIRGSASSAALDIATSNASRLLQMSSHGANHRRCLPLRQISSGI